MKCSIDHCDGKAVAKGFCTKHYRANKLYGDPLKIVQKQVHGVSLRERFETYVKKADGCWKWLGYCDQNGYGRLNVKGRPQLASRISFLLYRGDIPDGKYVCHKCDTPSCTNPDHLFLGTQADNVADMHKKGRDRKRGVPGSEHHASKLNDDAVRYIRISGESDSQLSVRFGVSRATVHAVKKGKTWTHVT